jgi:hypothetical protein
MDYILPNGTRVEKCNSEPKDTHRDGAPGRIIHRVGPCDGNPEFGYFVMWDDLPGLPVFIAKERVRRAAG